MDDIFYFLSEHKDEILCLPNEVERLKKTYSLLDGKFHPVDIRTAAMDNTNGYLMDFGERLTINEILSVLDVRINNDSEIFISSYFPDDAEKLTSVMEYIGKIINVKIV